MSFFNINGSREILHFILRTNKFLDFRQWQVCTHVNSLEVLDLIRNKYLISLSYKKYLSLSRPKFWIKNSTDNMEDRKKCCGTFKKIRRKRNKWSCDCYQARKNVRLKHAKSQAYHILMWYAWMFHQLMVSRQENLKHLWKGTWSDSNEIRYLKLKKSFENYQFLKKLNSLFQNCKSQTCAW